MGSCCSSFSSLDTSSRGNKPYGSTPYDSSSPNSTSANPPNRDQLLAAAEARAQSQKNKGVLQGGGKLSKKLEEEKKKSTSPVVEQPSGLSWKMES